MEKSNYERFHWHKIYWWDSRYEIACLNIGALFIALYCHILMMYSIMSSYFGILSYSLISFKNTEWNTILSHQNTEWNTLLSQSKHWVKYPPIPLKRLSEIPFYLTQKTEWNTLLSHSNHWMKYFLFLLKTTEGNTLLSHSKHPSPFPLAVTSLARDTDGRWTD